MKESIQFNAHSQTLHDPIDLLKSYEVNIDHLVVLVPLILIVPLQEFFCFDFIRAFVAQRQFDIVNPTMVSVGSRNPLVSCHDMIFTLIK